MQLCQPKFTKNGGYFGSVDSEGCRLQGHSDITS